MRVRAVTTVAVLVLVMAACSSDDTPTPETTTSPIPTPSAPPPTSASASPTEEPVADVVLSNFMFAPDAITVTSGDVLTLFNASTTSSHTFTVPGTVPGQPIDVILETQTGGEVTIDLEAGTYDLICKFHAETSGMVGTLVVEPIAA